MLVNFKSKQEETNRSKSRKPLMLPEKSACYVLITCSEPSQDGKMEIEMTYEGDAVLAAYLIESAQGRLIPPPEAPTEA